MSSAKVTIKTQDRSAIVPSLPGIYAGITVTSRRGPIGEPVLITSPNELTDRFGDPDPTLGVAMYSALSYLAQGNKLWVTRAYHSDATYAAATVRWKISDLNTEYPDYTYEPDRIVNPITAGLTQDQLDSYQFETFSTQRVHGDPGVSIIEAGTSDLIKVDSFGTLSIGDLIVVSADIIANLTGSETSFTVEDTVTIIAEFDALSVDAPVTVSAGDVIEKVEAGPTYVAYPGNPTVGKAGGNTSTVMAINADYIQPGDTIRIGGSGGSEVVMIEKNAYSEPTYFLQLDKNATVAEADNVYEVVEDEFEDRDAFLVYSIDPSKDWNKISIAITPSTNYSNAFNLVVYYEGVKVETWEVTRSAFIDGYGRQMFMEDKINGKSSYIGVRDNPNAVDEQTNVPKMPLFTDYSIWRRNSEDLFITSGLEIQENILIGHTQVQFGSDPAAVLPVGSRIKFVTGEDSDGNLTLSKEYKIDSIDSVNFYIVLDRPLEETQISTTWVDGLGSTINTLMYWFDASLNDAPNGVYNGVQRYKLSTIQNVYYNYPLNAAFTISGNEGVLLDPGANLMLGGSGGSLATVSDITNAIKLMNNKEKTPVTLMMDGGFAIPAVAQAILALCTAQGLSHGYVSCDPEAERSVNYKTDIVQYKADTGLNSELVSLFSGWVLIQDDYNQKEIYVAPDGFAAAAQSFTTRNYNIFTPAAGWTRGKISALGVLRKFEESDRDYLVENRINPIRSKEGSGLVIWGNETTLTRPSPLQLRSVSMLLIAIKYGLENMLEYKTFDLNNERTWTQVEKSLDGFMRDEIKAKGGVVDYQVAVKKVITGSDMDNRRMPVFLGIKPTLDIQEIPVTLAIFNNTVDIQVAL